MSWKKCPKLVFGWELSSSPVCDTKYSEYQVEFVGWRSYSLLLQLDLNIKKIHSLINDPWNHFNFDVLPGDSHVFSVDSHVFPGDRHKFYYGKNW